MRRFRTDWLVAAALAYLVLALWNFRAILPAPATLLPEKQQPDETYRKVERLDATMVLWTVTGNAARLLERPSQLRSEGQCHPLPRAYTLGEHMLGPSLLAVIPLALSGDPILAYNGMLVLTVWIAGLAMFLCAHHFTRSAPAAFVAGLLFALEPARMKETAHPFIQGDLWAPLALLLLHRTFVRGGLWNAVGCALFVGLTVAESLYALLGVLLVLGVYGAYAAWRHRHQARRWLGPLCVAALLSCAVAAWVLSPYVVMRATWDVLVRSGTTFMPIGSYAPGQSGFVGWILLALVLIALADRARTRRDTEGEDPRLALLCAALLVVWCSVRTVPVGSSEIPSPLLLLKRVLPGLDAVRALAMVGRGAVLPASLLASWGVLVLTERRGPVTAGLVAAALALLVAGERWVPAVAHATFGHSLTLDAFAARPPEDDVELLRAHARGALLDLPHAGGGLQALGSGGYLMLAAFSPRPVAACYNSFPSPLGGQVSMLALELPRSAAIDALVALGFETVLLHADAFGERRASLFTDLITVDSTIGQRIRLVGRSDRLLVFHLRSVVQSDTDPLQLRVAAPDANVITLAPGRRTVQLTFRNGSPSTYLQAAPLAPLPVELRWQDASGLVVHHQRARAVLPVALGRGGEMPLPFDVEVPDVRGTYDLTLRLQSAPEVPLVWTRVVVGRDTA